VKKVLEYHLVNMNKTSIEHGIVIYAVFGKRTKMIFLIST